MTTIPTGEIKNKGYAKYWGGGDGGKQGVLSEMYK